MKIPIEIIQTWFPRLLLAFVLVSVGFAWGKHVGLRQSSAGRSIPAMGPVTAAGPQVVVYYMHGTIRCITCNQIETLAKQTVEASFSSELAAGTMVWKEVDFDEEPALAKRYDVSASTVVVVRLDKGKDVSYQRLDKVWTLADKPEEFRAYVTASIHEQLDKKAEVTK